MREISISQDRNDIQDYERRPYCQTLVKSMFFCAHERLFVTLTLLKSKAILVLTQQAAFILLI